MHRVGKYYSGPRTMDGNWAWEYGADTFATRDAAVEHALKLSKKE